MTEASDIVIDARGLNCPLPVLRLRKRLEALAAATRVTLLASDPAARRDVPAFCKAHGHALLETHSENGITRFRIQKSA